jgi:hypothetical protein
MAVIISGAVFAPDGTPVPLARVYFVRGPAPMSDIAALTDADGKFKLSVSAAGAYVLECTSEEYAPKQIRLEVTGQSEIHLAISLSRRPR